MQRYAVRLAAVALVAAAAGLGVPGSAQAATCSSAKGVSVVVDFHQLGGGVQTFCDAGGAGKTAAAQFGDAGHRLTYVQREPGFVCRVDGAPSSDPCVNTPPSDAYWSVWWSDGKSGTWQYASTGVGSLTVPAGGYVALSWQGGSSKAPPGVTPRAHAAPSPSPTPSPSHSPKPAPKPAPTHATAGASTAPASTAPVPSSSAPAAKAGHRASGHHASRKPTPSAHPRHTHPPRATATLSAAAALRRSASPGSGGSGMPPWVPPALVGLLFAAAATVVVVRRKRSRSA